MQDSFISFRDDISIYNLKHYFTMIAKKYQIKLRNVIEAQLHLQYRIRDQVNWSILYQHFF